VGDLKELKEIGGKRKWWKKMKLMFPK